MEALLAPEVLTTLLTVIFGAGGFLVSVGAGIQWLLPWLVSLWREWRATSFRKVFEGYGVIYDALNRLVADSGAGRAILVRVHNGGGTPKIGSHLYASVIAEVRDHTIPSVRDRFQNRPVDETYVRMLLQLMDQKRMLLPTEFMGPSLLKDVYEQDGVKAVKISEVYADKDNYYLLATHYIDVPEDTGDLRSRNQDAAAAIYSVLKTSVNKLGR